MKGETVLPKAFNPQIDETAKKLHKIIISFTFVHQKDSISLYFYGTTVNPKVLVSTKSKSVKFQKFKSLGDSFLGNYSNYL